MKSSKKKKRTTSRTDSERLDEVIALLQLSAAVQLYQAGVKQQQIAKNLGIATASVNQMLKGIQRD